MINFLKLTLVTAISVLFFTGCGSNEPTPQMQGKIYTQTNMWVEKNRHLTTNYQRGQLIPVNTEVKILDYSSKVVRFQVVSTKQVIQVVNNVRFTQLDSVGVFKRNFSKSKVNISKFSKLEKEAISQGIVKNGMSKDAVIIARGFPPVHVTPSLTQNQWKYWQNRFVTRNVLFQNDKVVGQAGWGAR